MCNIFIKRTSICAEEHNLQWPYKPAVLCDIFFWTEFWTLELNDFILENDDGSTRRNNFSMFQFLKLTIFTFPTTRERCRIIFEENQLMTVKMRSSYIAVISFFFKSQQFELSTIFHRCWFNSHVENSLIILNRQFCKNRRTARKNATTPKTRLWEFSISRTIRGSPVSLEALLRPRKRGPEVLDTCTRIALYSRRGGGKSAGRTVCPRKLVCPSSSTDDTSRTRAIIPERLRREWPERLRNNRPRSFHQCRGKRWIASVPTLYNYY